MQQTLDGWDIVHSADTDWVPWDSGEWARAKVLGSADGYVVALVEAKPGYTGQPHPHLFPEFFYLIEGSVRNQGRLMEQGDGYAAAPGTHHDDFTTETSATYLIIFKV